MDFGTRIKTLRTQTGITQKQLAERLGVTKSVVSYYELLERSPSPEILVKMAQIFHVSTDYLLGMKTAQVLDISDLEEEDKMLLQHIASVLRGKNKK